MRFRTMVIAFVLTLAVPGMSTATEIYKWVDEQGVVHYVDLPTGAEGEEHLAIRSRPTNPDRVQASMQAREEAMAREAEAKANAPRGPSEEQLQAQARHREEQCNKYRERQTRFTENRRIYRMDENGERVYYSAEETQSARDKVDELVNQYCS